jgi:AcrR family transcriptional regulator
MYHHFTGKADLARHALEATAARMRDQLDLLLPLEQAGLPDIARYLKRHRDVLRGCRIGRMTQDHEVLADAALRRPLAETFEWLQVRLTAILARAQARREFDRRLDPKAIAATIVATLQGGYVLARAAASVEPFNRAIDGVVSLLAAACADNRCMRS